MLLFIMLIIGVCFDLKWFHVFLSSVLPFSSLLQLAPVDHHTTVSCCHFQLRPFLRLTLLRSLACQQSSTFDTTSTVVQHECDSCFGPRTAARPVLVRLFRHFCRSSVSSSSTLPNWTYNFVSCYFVNKFVQCDSRLATGIVIALSI